MLTAISSLLVPPERQEALEARFRNRKKLVDAHPGFRRLQLIKTRGRDEYLLVMEWDDMKSFQSYATHPDFQHAHDDLDGAITPGGLRIFDVILDSARGD